MNRIVKRRSRVITTAVLTALLLGVAIAAVTASAGVLRSSAPPTPSCSISSVAGAWGHNLQGWWTQGVLTPSSAAGRFTVDAQGNVSGTETAVPWYGGRSTALSMTGTLSASPDCTGTLAVKLYDPSNVLMYTEAWTVVYVDNQREMKGALATLTLTPNGSPFPYVSGTLNATKLFRPTSQ